MAGRFYVDTSAYLAILLREPGHEALVAELDGGSLLSSSLLVIQAERNLVRSAREHRITPDELRVLLDRLALDIEDFQFRDLVVSMGLTREMPMVRTPRTLDLVHLRSAIWFHRIEPLTRFVSCDVPQVEAARELGLPV